jgi:hypothetical protein
VALVGAVALGLSLKASAQDDGPGALLNLDPDALIEDGFADLPREPAALAAAISRDIEALRRLEFRESIAVSHQSVEEFGRYIDVELERGLPPDRAAAFGRVVEKLGLYRGPRIEDAAAVMRQLATSQVAAYYDPAESAFHVVLADAPMSTLAPIYAHELYHGLQDQHWDLDAWLLDGLASGRNDDEMFARQAVVEGEATYVMTLWMMEKLSGRPPSRFAVSLAVWSQAMLSWGSAGELIASGLASGALGDELEASADAMDDIPPFMLESLLAAYLKGMAFVHGIAGQGWDAVARIYDDPPRSSEQILHPEKYLRRDDPVTIEFPDFAGEDALLDWALLDANVIGEFQWRLIFDEFGFGLRSASIAAGWDGDRFAVLERDGRLLLLLLSAWDSPEEAREFAAAYQELLLEKYRDRDEAWTVETRGSEVLMVEGGERARLPDYLAIIARAVRRD